MTSILIKGGTIISADGKKQADILKVDGVITKIGEIDEPADEVIDASAYLVFPGLIDCHVHFREPGFEHKSTMATEAVSARAGGITCVCEMPNTNPPTTTVTALGDKIQRASDVPECDIRFYFGITSEPHLMTLKELWTSESAELQKLKTRCPGVKLYLDHSTGDQGVDLELVEDIFQACGEHNIPIIAHCEDPELNNLAKEASTSEDISAHSTMRPAKSEVKAIAFALEMAKKHNAQLQIAHLSTAEGLDLVIKAKEEGVNVTCEVAPHHLFFSDRNYNDLGTHIKMNPPVRKVEDNEALWRGLEKGLVDCIATDHAPHTAEEKQTEKPLDAPSGVPGVETALPLVLNRLTPEVVYRTMYQNPNRIFSLDKEDIVEGSHADIVLVDVTQEYEIKAADLHSKCTWTPYEGKKVKAKVVRVV